MSAPARSILVFGIYLYMVGLALMIAPNFLMKTFGMPETGEVWIRIVGMLAFCLGYYYHRVAIGNMRAFFKHTVPTRLFAAMAFTSFALLGYGPMMLIAFGAIDFAGAIWTWTSLKKG